MKLIPLRNRSTSMALGKCVLPTGKAKKAALLLFSVAVLLAGGAAKVRGQSALDGFDPNANGAVLVVVVQPDGKILLGGAFTTLSPNGGAAVTRNHIARLNPDGTLDTAFDPNANNNVYAIAVQADGKILVGGAFNGANSIGGATRNYIARLDPTTGAPDSFDPSANGIVHAIALQADGKILVGGEFNGANSIGGATRNRLARLDATTGAADSFDPNGNNAVLAIAVQADSKIIVSGAFNGANSIGGATRNFIARLDATTGSADSFDPNAIQPVYAIAVQADGKILAGGFFTTIGGATRNYIARLGATTGLADSFNPNANAVVRAIVVQADGKILAGGDFSGTNGIGGQTRNRIARLNATTGLADSFNPNANALVYAIAVQADGKVLTGGTFQGANSIGGQTRNYLARLEADGQLDRTLSLGIVGDSVLATAVQPDAKILLGGDFTTVLGVTRNNIARLNADGTLDTAFNPNASSTVYAIAVQADGKILVGGNFSGANSIGGQARNYIARLDATTGLADSFDPNANDSPSSIVVQADGKILVGGFFFGANSIGGATRNRIARLDATTGLADSFDPNANSYVVSIAVQADGKILAGGNFIGANSIGGATRNRIARLDAATGLADSFDPNANNNVLSIAVQADGKILAGGGFTIIGGATRNYIARLDTITGVADSFDPNASGGIFGSLVQTIALQADGRILMGGDFTIIGGAMRNRIARLNATTGLADSFNPNANNLVYAIAVQADGKILTGGDFSSINGQARNRFARLSNDTAALQSLAVTQTTITWTRDGSSAQCARVTFESSTDNVNYATLGNGTAAGSNWTLTDLNFPTGQNFYIRARGYHRSGGFNGSESITESVRNAFIGGPTPTPTPTATASPSPTPTPTPTLTATPTPTPTPTPALVVISQVFGGGGNTGAPYQNDFIEIFNRGSTSVNVGGWSVQYAAATGISWSVTPLCTGGGCMLAPGQYRLVQEASGGAVGAPLPPPDVTGTISMSATTGKVALVTSITPLSGSGCPFAGSVVDFVGYGLTANCFEGAGFAPAPSNTTADLRGGGGCMDTDNNAGDFATGAPVPRNTSAPLNACMTPAPTPTPTPTPPALISIAGAVTYCTHPTPIPSVTLTLTGTSGGSTLSDGSGNYTFASLASGGSYTVTPTKSALTPGAMGIDTVDVVATRRHYLQIVLLAGCPLAAADVNGDAVVDTTDVVAIQRFYLGQTTGIANVGKYSFTPVNRTYPVVVSDQTAQNYDTLVFGDVAPDFIHVPEGSLEAAAGEGRSGEVAATVATVALPEIVVDQSRSNFIAAVKSSAIEAKFDR